MGIDQDSVGGLGWCLVDCSGLLWTGLVFWGLGGPSLGRGGEEYPGLAGKLSLTTWGTRRLRAYQPRPDFPIHIPILAPLGCPLAPRSIHSVGKAQDPGKVCLGCAKPTGHL